MFPGLHRVSDWAAVSALSQWPLPGQRVVCGDVSEVQHICFHFIPDQDGAASLYVSKPLTLNIWISSEGFLKVEFVSRVLPSVRPVGGVPRTVSAASSSTCCRITPADRSVWMGFTPQEENVVAAKLTAECAPKMASAQVRKRRDSHFVDDP